MEVSTFFEMFKFVSDIFQEKVKFWFLKALSQIILQVWAFNENVQNRKNIPSTNMYKITRKELKANVYGNVIQLIRVRI